MTKFEDQSKHYQSYLNIGIVWVTLVLIMFLLTSCYVYESSYSPQQHNCELMARGDVCLSDHRCCNKQEHSTQIITIIIYLIGGFIMIIITIMV